MKFLIEGLRTLLILGRVSNLPTVWSNLIVGWTLADGPRVDVVGRVGCNGPNETTGPLLSVLLGGSLLYIGGMYLNDYCDAAFDARYCPQRPIPSGKISRRIVGLMAALWFTAGVALCTSFGPVTMGVALFLIAAIILYDIQHKNVAWAPFLMGFCRCLLYLLAFSAFRESDWFGNDYGDWWDGALNHLRKDCWLMALDTIKFFPAAIPLGLYVAGITYLARGESRPDKPVRWALLLLLLPVVVSIVVGMRSYGRLQPISWTDLLLFNSLLLGWMAWLLVPLWRKTNRSIGRVVSGLLAGIVLVDMIAVTPILGTPAAGFLVFFGAALLLQHMIPAT